MLDGVWWILAGVSLTAALCPPVIKTPTERPAFFRDGRVKCVQQRADETNGAEDSSSSFSCFCADRLSNSRDEYEIDCGRSDWRRELWHLQRQCSDRCSKPSETELTDSGVVWPGLLNEYPHDTHVVLSCQFGHRSVSGGFNIVCRNGTWNPPNFLCIPERRCPAPPRRGALVKLLCPVGECMISEYLPGDVAHITCLGGSRLEGSSPMVCDVTGAWTNSNYLCREVAQEDGSLEQGAMGLLFIVALSTLVLLLFILFAVLLARWRWSPSGAALSGGRGQSPAGRFVAIRRSMPAPFSGADEQATLCHFAASPGRSDPPQGDLPSSRADDTVFPTRVSLPPGSPGLPPPSYADSLIIHTPDQDPPPPYKPVARTPSPTLSRSDDVAFSQPPGSYYLELEEQQSHSAL